MSCLDYFVAKTNNKLVVLKALRVNLNTINKNVT